VPYRYLSQQPDSSTQSSSSISASRDAASSSRHIPWATASPLLVSVILDTTSIPTGQSLHWRDASTGERIALNVEDRGKGKSRQDDAPKGIVLERWTIRALPPSQATSTSQPASSSSSYRAGITHFRAMQPHVRQLPIQALADRLRTGQPGLKIGIRVASAEGTNGGDRREVEDAYRSLERGLVGLQEPFDSTMDPNPTDQYTFPAVPLSNGVFELQVQYRRDVDFWLANDADELDDSPRDEYFTPTIRPPIPNPVQLAPVQPIRDASPNTAAGLTATRPNGPLHPSRPSLVSEDSSRGRWSSTESLPFAVNSSSVSGSQTGRQGADRVSDLPRPCVTPAN
jgi:hypothetical protein